ncbi:MAG: hypothetical protein OET55_10265, partial [Desulfuromonadales bacterium]|nr:hypothetical protein [Desulfuromonadales bacterium]
MVEAINEWVYRPNKENTSLHQNSQSQYQKTNAKTLRKAKKGAEGDCSRLLKWFSLRAFPTPSHLRL